MSGCYLHDGLAGAVRRAITGLLTGHVAHSESMGRF
jgi:hypothetical protein